MVKKLAIKSLLLYTLPIALVVMTLSFPTPVKGQGQPNVFNDNFNNNGGNLDAYQQNAPGFHINCQQNLQTGTDLSCNSVFPGAP